MAENYLVVGDDKYIREREIQKIRDRVLAAENRDLNFSVHVPSDIVGVKNSLGTLPFLSDKRVVLLNDAETLSDSCAEAMIAYLEKPCDSSVLVISAAGSFKKTGHYKKLSRLARVTEAARPTHETMKKWIKGFFGNEGIGITDRAVELIVELKGVDTPAVKSEIEKLAAYSGGDKIDAGHVEKLVGRSVTESIFKLVDAVNARDAEWAFRIIGDLYNQKKKPTEIIGYLGWYMRMMQGIKRLSGRGLGADAIAAELGYSAAYVRRLTGQAEKYSAGKIGRLTELLLQADREIKTGMKSAFLAVEMLIVGFAGKS
ncbi:MAG: DNA polymerase III subunit delta [Candidatus Omnitrophica bacterium]|nr:DNA polymerase III subunit delta [Candidatus Omnitrophota bacterium]